jgi:asparagine synthase (glutamine-hydrolysing)
MCGIFGAIATDRKFEADMLEGFMQLTDLVHYRGPNDSGYIGINMESGPARQGDAFDVFLGNRRLSILDLSPAGHQPMHDGNGCWIVFNGEIFNYIELRDELQALGHQFSTSCDTEVILHVYDEYGEDGFEKLNGMWAFALVDIPRRRVVLSRDRFSIKPLYLANVGNRIYFGSEIKQLLPLIPALHINAEVMCTFLAQGLMDHSSETFFNGISQVPPKTNVVIDFTNGAVRHKLYWDYAGTTNCKPAEACEYFRELLTDSVRIRLRSDVKTGLLLSGGLDSSTLALISQALAQGNVETFSVVSEKPRYSEGEFITELISASGIANRKLVLQPFHIFETLEELIYYHDEPFGHFSVVALYKLLQLVKEQSDVVVLLSGQGGDEILLGYLKFFVFYLRDLVRQGKYASAAQQLLSSIVQRTCVRQLTIGEARRYLPFLNRYGHVITHRHDFVPIGLTGSVNERQKLDIDRYSVPALAHYEDRISMSQSLELRYPFLDHRVVDFAVNLPTESKIHNGWTKYILRQSFPELPDQIRWRRDKQGFTTPEAHWLKYQFSDTIADLFRKSRLGELGILNDRKFLEYYNDFRGGSAIAYGDVCRTLIAEMWARKTLDSQPHHIPSARRPSMPSALSQSAP